MNRNSKKSQMQSSPPAAFKTKHLQAVETFPNVLRLQLWVGKHCDTSITTIKMVFLLDRGESAALFFMWRLAFR